MRIQKGLFFSILLLGLCFVSSACSPDETPVPVVYSPIPLTSTPEIPTDEPTTPLATTKIVPPTATQVKAQDTPAPLPTAAPIDLPQLQPGDPVIITSISMITVDVGWGTSGGHVLYTEDGGTSWYDVTPPEPVLLEPNSEERAIGAFLDEENAWVAFADPEHSPYFLRVWITHDAGVSWAASYELPIRGGEFFEVELRLIDPLTGWLLADSIVMGTGRNDVYQLFHTVDGGVSWTETRMPVYVITDIEFSDPSTGWVTEEKTGPYAEPVEPFISITRDGGENWDTVYLPPPVNDPDLFGRYDFCSTYNADLHTADSGFLVVECFHAEFGNLDSTSYIYSTSDGGVTWQTSLLPLSVRGGATVIFFDPSEGILLGEKMYQTSDRGQTWEMFKQVFWQGQFSFIDRMRGWAVAQSEDEIALVQTTDGGQTWELLEPEVQSR